MNAEITPATIEIKTLTIDGKRMSASLYRQLHTGQLLHRHTGTYQGTPWGIVNIHDKECATFGQHIHVIFWQDNRLYTDTIYSTAHLWDDIDFTPPNSDAAARYTQAAYCLNDHEVTLDARYVDDNRPRWQYEFNGLFIRTNAPARINHECLSITDRDEAEQVLAADVEREKRRRANHPRRYAALCQLPQLFIG